jgi:DNA-binding PadR family transcriptional regulator
MYRDNTLIPTETIRLAALGTLMEHDIRYSVLASEVRAFVGGIIGPSLDLLGTSLELLTYEGLVEAVDGEEGEASVTDSLLRITDQGRETFAALMTSQVRAPVNDVSRLVIALKLRFLHLLDNAARAEQSELLVEMCETELARLEALKKQFGEAELDAWLELEIDLIKRRLGWFRALVDSC